MSPDRPTPPLSQPEVQPRRRWLQFSLRTLLLLVALTALAAAGWRAHVAPYVRQREAVQVIEKLGGTCQTAEAPTWLRWLGGDFQNVVQVNLARCDDPEAYLDHVADLPAVQLLIVGGPAFTDEHAARLHGLVTLEGLILDSTSVTDGALTTLRTALPQVEVYQSQRRMLGSLENMSDAPFHVVETELTTTHPGLQQLAGREWFFEAKRVFTRRQVRDDETVYLRTLRSTQKLHLSQSPVVSEALNHLQGFDRLDHLDLDDTQTSDQEMEAVGKLTRLQVLSLRRTRVTDVGLRHLVSLPQLRELYLHGVGLSDEGLEHFRGLEQLSVLDLCATKIRGPGLAHLQQLTKLQSVELGGTPLRDVGLEHVGCLRSLRVLALEETPVTDAGLRHLRQATRLEDLRLRGTRVTGIGLEHLQRLGQLQYLDLAHTRVADDGAAYLGALSSLRGLTLDGTSITDDGLEDLEALKNLASLQLQDVDRVTWRGVAKFRKAMPRCYVNPRVTK
jgi:hypothetical protein